MLPKGLLSKIGGLLAVISLTVLPLTGCGSYTISGIDLLTMKDLKDSIRLAVPIPLIAAILCAIIALFARSKTVLLTSGLVGLGGLLASYLIVKLNSNMGEMKMGGYFAIIGFLLIMGDAYLPSNSKAPNDEDTS